MARSCVFTDSRHHMSVLGLVGGGTARTKAAVTEGGRTELRSKEGSAVEAESIGGVRPTE